MKTRNINIAIIYVLLLACCPIMRAAEPTINDFIRDLQGPNARARAAARQLLPYQGVEAAPILILLLTNKDPVVAQAAFDILSDVGNQACAPGSEDQRKQVTECIMSLVQSERSERKKILGLRLLGLIAPAGSDIGPIADLLKDKTILRDKARVALQRMNTPESRAALRAALDGADPEFQCALLDSLGEMKDADSLDVIRKLCKNKDPAVRAAASRALSWTGDPNNLQAVKDVAASADADTRFKAVDAWLRLADTIAERPDHRKVAMGAFLEILGFGKGIEKIAALIGLGHVGDDSCIESIRSAIKNADPRIRSFGQKVLNAISGSDLDRKKQPVNKR